MALGEGDMSVAWVYGVVGIHPWFVAFLDEQVEQEIWGKDNSTLICSSLMPAGSAKPARPPAGKAESPDKQAEDSGGSSPRGPR